MGRTGWVAAALALGLGLVLFLAGAARASGARPAGPVPPPSPPPFYWLAPDRPTRRALPEPPPALPDLSVLWIERAPRYSRYCVDYPRGLPELCPGTESAQHFPAVGQIVTFTAVIANQGVITSPAAGAEWSLDGQPLAEMAPVPALAPGVTTTLGITWPWATAPHTVSLTLAPAANLTETSRSNNRLDNRTDALYLDVAVHPLVAEAFGRRRNLTGSWSFADWIQAQFAAMNATLAGSTYPAAPAAAQDRVRIDRITVTEDVGGDVVTSTLAFDGRWTFRVERDDPDTAEDEAAASAEAYAAAVAAGVDWGLVHELAHQIGVIDLYQLNVAGSYQNSVPDADGRPLLLGFEWPNPGLMGGGDRADHPWTAFDNHTVIALNRNHGFRRGYFGEYLFDLPTQSSLRVLDNAGQPLPGSQVTIYQTEGGEVAGRPVIEGLTDEQGRLALPNRALPLGGVTTATGHALVPNPFGAIDVVGRNGQLLVQVAQGDQRFFAWWPITEFNLAAWRGETAYERVLATHLPPAGAPLPPAQLDGQVDGSTVTLRWQPSPAAGVVAYRLYRGVEPAFYPFALIETTTDLSYTGPLEQTARFAVTAVDSLGRESGFSPIFRAPRLVDPVAVAVDPLTGERTVLDRHSGALITQGADGRWIGRQGSVHLGLTGGTALARAAQGNLLVAVAGDQRVKVLDGQRRLVHWFGQQEFVTGGLAGPSGVAQVGPAFTVELAAPGDRDTLGLADFDHDLRLSGVQPQTALGVGLTAGRFGRAVKVDGADRLVYDADGRVEPAAGSVQLWTRPTWPWNDGREHVFLEIGAASTPSYRLRLAKAGWNGLYAWLSDGPGPAYHDLVLYGDVSHWQPGEWHHLAVVWQPVQPGADYRRYTLWVDGILQDSRVLRRPVDGRFEAISVGAGLDGQDQADAVLDDLHISRAPRLGNSQRVRLLVSQGEAGRVDVLDWLGALISSFGELGDGPSQLDQPREVVAAGDRVWVADSGNGRVQVLRFDGDRLRWLASWDDDLYRPHGLALLPDGHLLVSDRGDDQVKLLDGQGHVLRRWTGPSDDRLGFFWHVAGLALLPNGDALVADAGNSRVVGIDGPLAPLHVFLPLVPLTAP